MTIAPGPAAGDDTVSRLAETLAHHSWCISSRSPECNCWPARVDDARALAPVVDDLIERAAREAAAAELEVAADQAVLPGEMISPHWLRDRAAALRAGGSHG